ncbi:hypothetical protein GOBAR_AA26605 [Gossypium barbadense]|uniref:Uncharacterized protein n=1 Tax=Gossypium barbadense TaxID=3634 RepID=A0A2P5WSK9_GOSBA|nr:hypothetical protein GOBAR_AA26605 [Gossypium barbadense]
MRFNKRVLLADLKRKISTKIATWCGKQTLRLFYKFSVSTNPLKFSEMKLEDNNDLGKMIAIYCPLKMDSPNLVELFTEIAESDHIQVSHSDLNDDFSDPDLDDIPEDIDVEGSVEGENVNPHPVENTGPTIIIRNNPRSFMTYMDPDTTLACEFPEYPNIVPNHLLDEEFDGEE